MYQQKKQMVSSQRLLILIVASLVFDIFMFGCCSVRFIQWSSAAYVITLITLSPVWLVFMAGWSSVMVNTIMHGRAIDELALTILMGLAATFLAERTVSLPFARHLLASVLMACCVGATLVLQAQSTGTSAVTLWTFFQIIANIIIVNFVLKYTS